MVTAVRCRNMRRPDTRFDFDCIRMHLVARHCLGFEGNLEVADWTGRGRQGLHQPFDIVDIVHMTVKINVAAAGAEDGLAGCFAT